MDGRGRVECVLHDHLDAISATEAQDGSEDGRGIAERPRGLSLVELMEAGRCPQLDDASDIICIDQPRNGKMAATALSLASAEPRIQHGSRRKDARSQC